MGKKDDYNKYVDQVSPKPTYVKNYILAFIVGGIICMIGQGINDFFMKVINLDKLAASSATSITLIFIGSFLTGLGVYDLIGKRAGAGTFIPITGFSNSMTSSALEAKSEGLVTGIGANIFKLGGTVITFGIVASFVLGGIRYVFSFIW